MDGLPDGNWVGPTIVDNVKPSMDLYKTEVFGPVLQVLPYMAGSAAGLAMMSCCEWDVAASHHPLMRSRVSTPSPTSDSKLRYPPTMAGFAR